MGRSGQGGSPPAGLTRWSALGSLPQPACGAVLFLVGFLAGGMLWPHRLSGPVSTARDPVIPGPVPVATTAPRPATPGSGAAEAKDSADKGKGLRFAAYNLRNYLPMARENGGRTVERAPKPEGEISVVVDSIAQLRPDILGVCEIGGVAEVEDLRRRLRDRGLEFPHVEWVDGADEDRHLALFSAFPIAERRSQTRLSYLLDGREYPVQRGFLDATVAVNSGYRLRCIGVHFKSKREVLEGDQELMRRNEAHLLRRYLDGILKAEPEANLMAYGDFNDTRNEAAIRAIQGPRGAPGYLAWLPLRDGQGETWTHHWGAADIYSRIDFIFCSKGLMPEVDPGRSFVYARDDWENGSDHRVIVAAIFPGERRR